MCCGQSNSFTTEDVDGECEDCGESTVDGAALDCCSYSPCVCDTCGYAPCDQSC